MKTQFSFTKSGFTMVEIMVVIVIIWIMFSLFSQINFRSQENITKAERIANKLQSILHSSSVSVMMWRMDQSIVPKATTWATIIISASGVHANPNRVTWQLAPTLSGVFQAPFFDGDPKYQIESIKGCVGWWSTNSGTTTSVQIQVDKNGTIFTGSTNPGVFWVANILEIQVRYIDMAKKVIFDRRTWRIEIRRSGEDLCK